MPFAQRYHGVDHGVDPSKKKKVRLSLTWCPVLYQRSMPMQPIHQQSWSYRKCSSAMWYKRICLYGGRFDYFDIRLVRMGSRVKLWTRKVFLLLYSVHLELMPILMEVCTPLDAFFPSTLCQIGVSSFYIIETPSGSCYLKSGIYGLRYI
jgi:hypothetical protein